MSPRFDRRPEKRMGTGGRGSGSRDGSGRPPGRPPRFSGPKPEWKRPAEPGAASARSGSSGERRPFERRSADGDRSYGDRPYGNRAYGDRRSSDRGRDRGGDRGRSGDRPRTDWDRRGGARSDGRPGDKRSDGVRFEGQRFEGKRFEGPRQDNFRGNDSFRGHDTARSNDRFRGNHARPERRRFDAERPDGSRFDRPGRDGRERFGTRPVVVDAPGPAPTGESERHGLEVAPDLIWGRHSAQAALESGRPIHRIWCTPEMRFSPKFLQLLREAKASGVLVEEVTWARLGQLTGGAVHQGIALQTAAAETLDLPSLIEGCASLGEAPLLMAVDGLTDPHNLGAIVRSAEALGAHGLVLPQRRSAGLTGSVAKVAAGALEHLPVARVVNLNRALDSLKQEGYRVVGLAGEGTVSLEEADLDGPLVIVTGSEGDGLSMLTRRNCDQLVRIPLRGATPSLNASVATALLLYEVARRGWMKGLSGSQPAPRIVRPQLPSQAAAELVEPALPDPADDQLEPEAALPQFPGDRPANEPLDLPQIAPEHPAPDETAPEPSSAEQLSPAATPVLELGLTPTPSAGFQGDIQL